jgi:hypothetical protein
MRAGGADREELVAAPREKHGVVADVPGKHPPVRKRVRGDALREIGAFRLRVAHVRLLLGSCR